MNFTDNRFFPKESFANILVSLVRLGQKCTITTILETNNILLLEFQTTNLTVLHFFVIWLNWNDTLMCEKSCLTFVYDDINLKLYS